MQLKSTNLQPEQLRKIQKMFSQGLLSFGGNDIDKWVIRHGMEFNSPWIWWGDTNKTREESYGGAPHEGLDFALAKKCDTGHIEAGMEGMPVHAFVPGTLVWRFSDLVGDTAVIATEYLSGNQRLVFQYSHLKLHKIPIGSEIPQEDSIGEVAKSDNPNSITASHLHLSTAFIDEDLLATPDVEVCFDKWLQWAQNNSLIYIDPFTLMSSELRQHRFLLPPKGQSSITSLICTSTNKKERIRLRRTLARNFPGIRCISKKSLQDISTTSDEKSLIISFDHEKWSIKCSYQLFQVNSGQGYQTLIDHISRIDLVNTG